MLKNLQSKILLLLVSFGLVFSMAACGDNNNNDNNDLVVQNPPADSADNNNHDNNADVEPEVIVEDFDEDAFLKESAANYFNTLPENNNMMQAAAFKEQFDGARDSVFVLDIRAEADFQEGHLEGAVNIPMRQIGQNIDEIPTDKEIAVVCYSGQTASQTVGVLKMAGYNAKVITGGFGKITEEEFEIVQ